MRGHYQEREYPYNHGTVEIENCLGMAEWLNGRRGQSGGSSCTLAPEGDSAVVTPVGDSTALALSECEGNVEHNNISVGVRIYVFGDFLDTVRGMTRIQGLSNGIQGGLTSKRECL